MVVFPAYGRFGTYLAPWVLFVGLEGKIIHRLATEGVRKLSSLLLLDLMGIEDVGVAF